MADTDQPAASKIIVDSDWKSQARAEKERLAEQERAAADRQRADTPATGLPHDPAHPDAGSPFQALLGTLVTQALMYLGAFPDPQTGRALVSLDHARFHIDLLAVLEEKTRGNLSDAESQDLTQALYELRLRFLEISKAVAAMAQEKAAAPSPPAPHLT